MAPDNRDGEMYSVSGGRVKKRKIDCNATSGCGVHYWFVTTEAGSLLSEHCVLKAVQPAQVKAVPATCTGESTSAERKARRHVDERTYTSCET